MFWMFAAPEHSQYSKSHNIASKSILEPRGSFACVFSMFRMLAPPEHSQYSNSYNIATESILELRGTLYHETEKTLTRLKEKWEKPRLP